MTFPDRAEGDRSAALPSRGALAHAPIGSGATAMIYRPGLVYGLLFLLTTVSYLDRTTLSVAAPQIAAEFRASPVEMGYLLSAFLWTYLLCLVPIGYAVDRFGAGAVAAGGIALWSLAAAAGGASSSFGALLMTRLVLGAGESTAYPAGVRVIREVAPPRERGLATAWLNAGSYAGPAIGALLTGWLISRVGWRLGFAIAGALGLFWLVPWIRWLKRTGYARGAPGREQEERRSRAAAQMDRADDSSSRGLVALLRRRSTWGMALTQGAAVYAQYVLLTWLPSYLQQSRALDVQSAALYTAIPYLVSVLLALAACRLSDGLMTKHATSSGRRRRMVAATLLCGSIVVLSPWVHSTGLLALVLALALSGIASAISLNLALAGDLLQSADDVGKAASLVVFVGNLFGVLAPIVTGYLIAATGRFDGAFVVAGVVLAAGAGVSLSMTPATKVGNGC